jgi:sulfur relay (sulfurtransferase) DsrC/TusE family protein
MGLTKRQRSIERRKVFEGELEKTTGGLSKKDLVKNKQGRIVSKARLAAGQKAAKHLTSTRHFKISKQLRQLYKKHNIAAPAVTEFAKAAKAINDRLASNLSEKEVHDKVQDFFEKKHPGAASPARKLAGPAAAECAPGRAWALAVRPASDTKRAALRTSASFAIGRDERIRRRQGGQRGLRGQIVAEPAVVLHLC